MFLHYQTVSSSFVLLAWRLQTSSQNLFATTLLPLDHSPFALIRFRTPPFIDVMLCDQIFYETKAKTVQRLHSRDVVIAYNKYHYLNHDHLCALFEVLSTKSRDIMRITSFIVISLVLKIFCFLKESLATMGIIASTMTCSFLLLRPSYGLWSLWRVQSWSSQRLQIDWVLKVKFVYSQESCHVFKSFRIYQILQVFLPEIAQTQRKL